MAFKRKQALLLLSILSGLLFAFSWPTYPFLPFIFIAFVPLFIIESTVNKASSLFLYSFISFLIWNASSTWWIINSTLGGGLIAVVANSLLMTLPVLLFHKVKKNLGDSRGYISIVFFWITFEYTHLNWDLSWPWLTLGNVFSGRTEIIQWYEYTGVLGGSLWILIANIALYKFLKLRFQLTKVLVPGLVLFLPILFSFFVQWNFSPAKNSQSIECIVAQPNYDPYNQKFEYSDDFIPYEEQIDKLISISEEKISNKTVLLAWPETAIQGGRYIPNLNKDPEIHKLIALTNKYPKLTVLTGVETWNRYNRNTALPSTAKFREDLGYYDNYNSAVAIHGDSIQVYNKSKFVPGVEKLPFPKLLGWVVKIIDFDGAGTYGSQEERTPITFADSLQTTPLICYESVFGDFVSQFCYNGADLITIITNDGWWKDTDGHKQHNLLAKLRAIENRRYVLRSANTGISSIIDWYGNEIDELTWWKRGTLKRAVFTNSEKTLYTQYGDLIGRVSPFFSLLIIFYSFVRKKTKK